MARTNTSVSPLATAVACSSMIADDSASTEIHLLNGAHFLLESHLDDVTALIRPFLERTQF